MATKATGKVKAAASAAADGVGADDVTILQPDNEVIIDGRKILVREYRYFEGARVLGQARVFFDALYALFGKDGLAPAFDDITMLLGQFEREVVALVAAATDLSPEVIRNLDDRDGEALMLTWWVTNAGFFTRRVLRRALHEKLAAASPNASPASSISSLPPATSAPSPNSPS